MYSTEVIRSEMRRGVAWALALREQESIGFYALEIERSPGQAKLHKLYLLPSWHGKGAGRKMLEHVKGAVAAAGARRLYLQVNKRNARAIKAYQRAGFRVAEEIVADIGLGFVMDDYVMEWVVPVEG
jgi:GNAT superfamily N-acetyltransferase